MSSCVLSRDVSPAKHYIPPFLFKLNLKYELLRMIYLLLFNSNYLCIFSESNFYNSLVVFDFQYVTFDIDNLIWFGD